MQLHVGRMYHWKTAAKHFSSEFMTRQHIVLKTEGWQMVTEYMMSKSFYIEKRNTRIAFETQSIAKYIASK